MDHIWEDWCGDSVLRVKDLMDISHLRAAKLGVDASYKTYVISSYFCVLHVLNMK
jgi:hypothetical protein